MADLLLLDLGTPVQTSGCISSHCSTPQRHASLLRGNSVAQPPRLNIKGYTLLILLVGPNRSMCLTLK